MMKQFFDDMTAKMEAGLLEKNTAREKFNLEVTRLGQRLYSGNQRLALCGVCAPFDLLNAMGINSCFVEFWGGVLATAGIANEFMEAAERFGKKRSLLGRPIQEYGRFYNNTYRRNAGWWQAERCNEQN